MALTLDPAIGRSAQRIQRELERGPYTNPAELLGHALDLLEAQEQGLQSNQQAI
jgi:hypothetical protein